MNEITQTKNAFLTWLAGFGDYAPLLRILLTVILIAIGLFGARLFRWIFHQLRSRLEGKIPDWLQILFDGFIEPAILFVRCLLWYFAFLMFPWSFDSTSPIWDTAGTIIGIAAVCLLTQGLWNSAGLCRLLLRSAQNRLDLETNKTMNSFFEKIYRALVLLFGGIQVLNLLGCEVNGLTLAVQNTILVDLEDTAVDHVSGSRVFITFNQGGIGSGYRDGHILGRAVSGQSLLSLAGGKAEYQGCHGQQKEQ